MLGCRARSQCTGVSGPAGALPLASSAVCGLALATAVCGLALATLTAPGLRRCRSLAYRQGPLSNATCNKAVCYKLRCSAVHSWST